MIPRIVHRVAIGEVPEQYDDYWAEWQELNPDWEFKSWTGPFDPDDWELGRYHGQASCPSQLSDFLRWEIIWREGGIYTDWDVQPLKPVAEWEYDGQFFIGTEDNKHLSPGLFAATQGHEAVRACIREFGKEEWTRNPSSTGPQLSTRVLKGRSDVYVVSKYLFYPYHYSEMHRAGWSFPDAYAVHHWGHSWADVPL